MLYQKILLSKERNVTLTTYLLDDSAELHPGLSRPLIIVCPGGGYSFLSDREAEVIATQYTAAGYHAAVLRYGICEHAVVPGPFCDLAEAVGTCRDHAAEWHIDSNAIFVSGFSAGAHVAAGLCVFWNRPEVLGDVAKDSERIRPNGAILGYPVLDLHASATHLDIQTKPGEKPKDIQFGQKHPKMPLEKMFVYDKKEKRYFINFENAMNAYLFDGEFTEEQEDFYSLQNQVSENTPPTFLWHGGEDNLILPKNSLQYAAKLAEYNVPYELHIFGKGGHGLALANAYTGNHSSEMVGICRPWIRMAIRFIDEQSGYTKRIKRDYVND